MGRQRTVGRGQKGLERLETVEGVDPLSDGRQLTFRQAAGISSQFDLRDGCASTPRAA